MNTYAIGDIQGCFDELIQLLELMNFNRQKDHLICVGDVVNRGPKSLKTLEFLASLPNCTVTLGNHDFHLLRAYHLETKTRASDTIDEILLADNAESLCYWLQKQPLIYCDDKYKIIFVHAGIYPYIPFDTLLAKCREIENLLKHDNHKSFLKNIFIDIPKKYTNSLTTEQQHIFIHSTVTLMRYLQSDQSLDPSFSGNPKKAPQGIIPWYTINNPFITGYQIVFGHWSALNGENINNKFINLDTGCVWSNQLTGIRISDRKLFSVPSMQHL